MCYQEQKLQIKNLFYCAQVTPPTKDNFKYFGMVSEINRLKCVSRVLSNHYHNMFL